MNPPILNFAFLQIDLLFHPVPDFQDFKPIEMCCFILLQIQNLHFRKHFLKDTILRLLSHAAIKLKIILFQSERDL
jgi:hypothetical protein